MGEEKDLIYPELSYEIMGLLFEVHNDLGKYCNEKQYGDAIEQCCEDNQISFERQKHLDPSFKGAKKCRNRIDFIIEDKIILELKAKRGVTKEDYYQTRRYLKAADKKLGIIVNFRNEYLNPKRVLNPDTTP
jgi:GxxExxY protein